MTDKPDPRLEAVKDVLYRTYTAYTEKAEAETARCILAALDALPVEVTEAMRSAGAKEAMTDHEAALRRACTTHNRLPFVHHEMHKSECICPALRAWGERCNDTLRAKVAELEAENARLRELDLFPIVLEGAKRTDADKKLSVHNVRHIVEALREALGDERREGAAGRLRCCQGSS